MSHYLRICFQFASKVSYNVTFPETLQSEAPPELLERQQQLTWQRRKVAEQKDRLQMERQWVVNFSVEKQKITEKSNTSVEEARQLLKFYSEQLQRIDEAILEVDRTLTGPSLFFSLFLHLTSLFSL